MTVVKFPKPANPPTAADDTSDVATRIAQAQEALTQAPQSRRRAQLRIPLDNTEDAILSVTVIALAASQALEALVSSQRQRRPGLLCPLATCRQLFEQANRAINAKRQGR